MGYLFPLGSLREWTTLRVDEKGAANDELTAPLQVPDVSVQDACQEVPGGLLARVVDDLLRRALLDDLAVPKEHDAVGRLAGEADLVRRHEDGRPLRLDFAHEVQDLTDEHWVQRCRDLVQQE